MGWLCCGKPRVEEPADAVAVVPDNFSSFGRAKTADGCRVVPADSSSSHGDSPMISCSVSRQDTAASMYFDCLDRFLAPSTSIEDALDSSVGSYHSLESLASTSAPGDSAVPGAPRSAASSVAGAGQAPIADLPAELQQHIKRYLKGANPCAAVGWLWNYLDTTGTTLAALQQQLAPVVAYQADAAAAAAAAAPPSYCPPGQPAPKAVPLVSSLLSQLEMLRQLEHGLQRQEGFRQVSFGALQLYYHHDAEAKKHYLKAHAILDEPITHVVCLAREVDLVASWNPAMSQVEELATLSANEIIAYMAVWVPWPLHSPEVLLRGVGADLLDVNGSMLLACSNQDELPPGVSLPKYNGTRQRMHVDVGGFRFSPLPSLDGKTPRTDATVLLTLDASKWAIPEAVVTFILKVFAPLVYNSVVSVLKKMFHKKGGSELAGRLQIRRELYDRINEHMLQRLAKTGASSSKAGTSS